MIRAKGEPVYSAKNHWPFKLVHNFANPQFSPTTNVSPELTLSTDSPLVETLPVLFKVSGHDQLRLACL